MVGFIVSESKQFSEKNQWRYNSVVLRET